MQIRKKTEGTNMITVQTDSRDVCAVTYVGVRSNAFRAINHSIKPNFQPKSIPPPFLFASPLLSLPIIWIRESKLNLFYKRRIIDPLKVFIIIIYSLFQKQLKIIINRISSERVRTFANSASIDHLCSNRARTCVCVCVCVLPRATEKTLLTWQATLAFIRAHASTREI